MRSTIHPGATKGPTVGGPPGLLFNGAAIAMFVVAVWRGSERTDQLDTIMLVALGWLILLLGWLIRVLEAAADGTVRGSGRWVLAPALFAIAAILVFGGFAFDVRFGLSRAALDQAAMDALAGQVPAAGWIGLYPVREVTVDGGSVRIDVDGQEAFVRGAPPVDTSSPVWYVPIDEHWSRESWAVLD